ncbi:phosphate signaling complex protein PhoU [Methanohalophilus halophilus]|uniref:Phosphate-specific transport system accessory protein PhoU n=1 Tax=Methanohalophilus halophilus TaxID=2177 RepID=A0A1L3Q435_9EURY|nr:phosphate signaling complex protein PhoU [Methanohalophilus halophilus]APH39634.1 phosphate transport system regulatory protein PhoU [Methanohalophilus halophilus]RNI09030.1 phosphate signaling complex protein PhoU [Methanohalophilus halophilus]SDW33916.1 phosphate uptake regulator, PhoU [Methanohalophilus halophilus]
MVREKYFAELEELKNTVSDMSSVTLEMFQKSIKALANADKELAEEIIEMDEIVNDFEMKVENRATSLLALQQPIASDLRLITASYHIAIDLERMSDLAVDVAKRIKKMNAKKVLSISECKPIVSTCEEMIEQSIKAYAESDVEMAKKIASKDEIVDKNVYAGWEDLVQMMIDNTTIIENAVDMMFVLRYLERIADHTCNICESIVYIATAKRVDLN